VVHLMLAALIGTWGCAPRATDGNRSFTLTVTRVNAETLGLQGVSLFPPGTSHYHTLTNDANGDWTVDEGLVPDPLSGRESADGSIVFARPAPNLDRLYWKLSPDGNTLNFSLYKSTDFDVERAEHMVTCTRTSSSP
jgi:hypothetical protein